MENQNKTWIAVSLGVVVIFGIVIYAVMYGGGRTLDRGDGDSELEYTSGEYDFSFERPRGYDLLEVSDPDSGRHSIVLSRQEDRAIPENGEGPTAITIDVFAEPNTLDVAEWVRTNNVSNFNLAIGEIRETLLDGEDAVAYEWDGLYRGRSIALEHNGRIILISGTYLEPSDPIYADFDRVTNSFELD